MKKIVIAVICVIGIIGAAAAAIFLAAGQTGGKEPDVLLTEYMNHIERQEYAEMYALLDSESTARISEEDFVTRNSRIYEGIEAQDLQIEVLEVTEGEDPSVTFHTAFDSIAGTIDFDNEVYFVKEEEGYRLSWNDAVIFPGMESGDKVAVSETQAERGRILDRNGSVLAGSGLASSVGIVPGKLTDRENAVKEIAELLGTDVESIENKLNAGWVQEDSFVPIQTVPKTDELAAASLTPDEEALQEIARQEQLLTIPGVAITDIEVRTYPLEEAAAHLIGYVQNVTAEDLEEHAGEGYNENSVIGRSGMEALYETELKGEDGCSITIVDAEGAVKTVLANKIVQNGKDVRLTIDASLQSALYAQFREDKSCSVAMNPYTGEVLALVSTPSYDDNDFIRGMSEEQWNLLNEDERNPMYNRFRQIWCPGSTFKPIIAAIGLDSGAIDPAEDYGNEGLSWQKDASWGDYFVTTLHAYEPVTLQNAMMYSDNIYFAKAALKIGADTLADSLDKLGFGEELPFEIVMTESQYSNDGEIASEVQLADSGYGQGQILVNPLHLASLYTAFCNQGNVIKPYLLYQEEAKSEIWLPQAFSHETTAQVLESMKQVVNNPEGTGYAAYREDLVLAGKTGTAEIKESVEDTDGTELGWFAVFTADLQAVNTEMAETGYTNGSRMVNPILLVSMAEDVKEIGGSGYVIRKDKVVLDAYLQ